MEIHHHNKNIGNTEVIFNVNVDISKRILTEI